MAGDEQFVFRARSDRRDGAGLEESWRRLGHAQAQGHPLDRASLPWPFTGPLQFPCPEPGIERMAKKSLIKIPVLLSPLVENDVDEAGKRERKSWSCSTDSVTSRENAEINKPWRARNISKTVLCSRRARGPSFIRRERASSSSRAFQRPNHSFIKYARFKRARTKLPATR